MRTLVRTPNHSPRSPFVHGYPQQPEFWLHPIIGPRLWSYRSSLYIVHWEALSYVDFSPPAQFLLRVNMKDRIGRLRRRKLGPVSSIYIYIWSEIFRTHDRAKSEAKYGGHGDSKFRRFQSPCAIFTIRVNMKDRVGRLRRRKLWPPLAAIFGFTR